MFQLQLKHILEAKDLAGVLELMSQSAGFNAKLVDVDGNPALLPPSYQYPQFCDLIRSSPCGREKCCSSYRKAGLQSVKFKEPFIFRCHAGLVGWAIPVFAEERHVSTVVYGQALMSHFSTTYFNLLKDVADELKLNYDSLKQALKSVKKVEPGKDQIAAELVYIFANYQSHFAKGLHRESKRFSLPKFERILAKLPAPNRSVYLEKEKELLHYVSLKDRSGALPVLSRLLKDLISSGNDLEWIKNRVIEMLVLISRAACDAGLPNEAAYQVNNEAIQKVMGCDREEKIYIAAKETVNLFFASMPREEQGEYKFVLAKAVEYIQGNYANPALSLSEVAKAVYLSPSYLSHLFKKELSYTVNDLITLLRLEEAKRLLREKRLPVGEIGQLVGYANPSYFVKVFKKDTGMTPLAYRTSGE
ncbi:PocR ligand-binding domain-containing protein [Candidatus Formimonas warabiya]|uniref:HTH araC/xylS-type domain-containing protein n=1 Tax=Formimonas warabiya TaxID=1761012 RepID=A0A3G1KRV8_FORW1|nr:PocR ligand-binding domain-containing protein [Candidatus Formimonas warabiya]ATW24865.1 hypothetical protein DCMF_08840 [Candidatus Formimonas warabiya]